MMAAYKHFGETHRMKARHTRTRVTHFTVTFNPVGVGSVEAETCVSNRETIKQGPRAFFSVNNTSKDPLSYPSLALHQSPPNINQTLSLSVLTDTHPPATPLFLSCFCHSVAGIISVQLWGKKYPSCCCFFSLLLKM